jgi:hypothetical protein
MRLSDIMSSMQLSSYAEVALLLFLGAFIAVAVSLFWGRKSEEWERCRQLPLDGTEPSPSAACGAPTSAIAPGNHQP